jgi:AcrR family transcriptional regulator
MAFDMAGISTLNPSESQAESSAAPSRHTRRRLALHRRILEVARELFASQGYAETRVADVCERADIAQKTFFNHFPSKLDLLREIAHAGIEELMLAIEESRKAKLPTRDRIHLFFDTIATHIAEAGPKNRELLVEVVNLISGDAAERSVGVRRLHAAFRGLVEDGLAQGDVTRRHDPQALTEMILGAYYVLIFNYANLDDFPIRERGHAAARILADALAPRAEESHGTP